MGCIPVLPNPRRRINCCGIGQKAGGWIPALLQRKSRNKKSIKEKHNKTPQKKRRNKKGNKLEGGCRAERGIWVLGHESQLLTGTLCAVFHCWEWKKLFVEVEKGL